MSGARAGAFVHVGATASRGVRIVSDDGAVWLLTVDAELGLVATNTRTGERFVVSLTPVVEP